MNRVVCSIITIGIFRGSGGGGGVRNNHFHGY